MNKAARMAGMLVGIAGLFQLVVGVLMWTGRALSLTNTHMAVGIVFVLALWTIATIATRSNVGSGLTAFAYLWGVVVVLFGIAQTRILPGPNHWIIRVLHLLVGLAAMGMAGAMTRRIREAAPHPHAPTPELHRAG